jgi:adenylate cyclase class 2
VEETEIKLRVVSPEKAREALASLGARLCRARHFEDNVLFDDAAGRLRGSGRVIRLRRTPAAAIATYKGPGSVAAGVRSREEIEFSVSDADGFEKMLAAIELRPTFRYQKYREVFSHRDVEIVIDETPLGTFLEIEGPPATIHATAAALGYAPTDYVLESYAGLFAQSGGRGDMTFPTPA